MAKILLHDIETSPIIGYTWGLYEQNVIEIIEDWQVLCVAYKWLGETETHMISQDELPMYRPGVNSDFMVVAKLQKLFDEADIVVGHNSDTFDNKKLQARMMIHGLNPPSPYMQIDTKKVAKRYGAFTSNKLADLAKDLGIARKGETGGFETWKGCMAGDPKAWAKMKEYNKQDVVVLEELYLRLRPWITNHPNLGLIDRGDPDSCENCSGTSLNKRGTRYTNRRRYHRLRCNSCGHWQKGALIKA